jgi:hypothetical protein
MEFLQSIGVLFGSSWASGINLYMTTAGLGIADKMHLLSLPENLKIISNPAVILIAALLYGIEFIADKIPFVDNIWDSVHTLIRPAGGATLGYLAAAPMGPTAQIPLALLTGAIAASAHLTKATSRVAINSTPIPGTNIIASLGEDASVGLMLFFVIKHPIIALMIVTLLILFAIWFLGKMFRFLKKVFGFSFGKNKDEPTLAKST